MSKKTSGFESLQLHCPFRHKCNCYVAIKLMKYPDKTVMMQAGDHTCESHVGKQRGVLTVKQRGAVVRAARAAPLSVGRQVHDGLLDDSPGKRVPFDKRSQSAVNRLVRKVRGQVMEERLGPGIDVDGTEGSMNRLAESLSLAAFIKRHNDPEDEFHLEPHQPVCVGHQFGDGVIFMTLSTPHLLNNMARAKNCGWQTQGHFDAAFNWCGKDFAMIGFGMNSMGAHFNPVSMSLVNSESKKALSSVYAATCAGLHMLYKDVAIRCENEKCGFCSGLAEQLAGNSLWRTHLQSVLAKTDTFVLNKPSSDNCKAFHSFAKETFGKDVPVQQCGQHLTGATLVWDTFGKYLECLEN
jgi:hypothetical protein